jgi:hypothetical protein
MLRAEFSNSRVKDSALAGHSGMRGRQAQRPGPSPTLTRCGVQKDVGRTLITDDPAGAKGGRNALLRRQLSPKSPMLGA